MIQTVRHLRSTTAGTVPSSLLAGQIGVNHTDGKLFYRSAGGAVISRSLRDCGVLIAKGNIVSSTANVTFNVDPAVIGIMKMFSLRINDAFAVSSAYLIMRFGSSAGIKSGSSDYSFNYLGPDSTAVFDNGSNASNSMMISDNSGATTPWHSEVLISTNDPTPTMFRSAVWQTTTHTITAGWFKSTGNGWLNSDIDLTQIQVLMNGANISKMKYCLIGYS